MAINLAINYIYEFLAGRSQSERKMCVFRNKYKASRYYIIHEIVSPNRRLTFFFSFSFFLKQRKNIVNKRNKSNPHRSNLIRWKKKVRSSIRTFMSYYAKWKYEIQRLCFRIGLCLGTNGQKRGLRPCSLIIFKILEMIMDLYKEMQLTAVLEH